MESGEVLALGNPAGVERPSTPLKARWRIVAADTCELCATRQKVKASAICFVLPSRLPLELGGEGSADIFQVVEESKIWGFDFYPEIWGDDPI